MKKRPSLLRALEKRVMLDAALPAIAGQVLWLDADDAATVLDADNTDANGVGGDNVFSGAVQTWLDKSGSGFHVSAAGAANRPAYTTHALNGHSVLTFDGGSDTLRNTGAVINGDDYTMFVVFNRTTAANRDAIFEMGNGASRNALFVNEPGGGGAGKINMYHNATFYHPSAAYTTGAYAMFTSTVNTNAYTLTQNGAVVGTGTVSGNRAATTGIYVGNDSSGGDELQGNIAEILVYDRDLSAEERHDIETYLAAKWGLTIANAAPAVAVNTGASLDQGASLTLTSAMLGAADADNTDSSLIYTITDASDHGTLFRDADNDGLIDPGEALALNATFTQADIDGGLIKYTHDGSANFADAFSFTVSDQLDVTAAATFALTIDPVNSAPAIQGWTLVSSEDFQAGATGWHDNTTTNGGAYFSRYLGPFSSDGGVQSNFKTYTLSGTQDYTVIAFDFYRIDSWDNEAFRIWIDDTQVFSQNFSQGVTTIPDGSFGAVSWTVTEMITMNGHAGGMSNWNDQTFRFTMTIQNSAAAAVKIGFGSTTNQGVTDESWGIDNVMIYEAAPGGVPGPFSLAEHTANGQVVGRITATDPEADTITYSITGGTGQGVFAINAATGVITVINSAALDYESVTSFTLEIRATDNGMPSLSDTETITINLIDIPENTAPSINPAGPFTIAENAANNTLVGTLTGSDPQGHTISWSITAGNTDNIFSINGSGEIRVSNNANLNYEWDNQYVLTIQAQDNGFGNLAATRTITINITDINEAPTFDTHTALMAADPYLRYNAATGNYYKYISATANYATASSNAAAQTLHGVAGHLVTITSAAENTYVRGLGSAQIWLGGTDTTVEGEWRWVGTGPEGGQQFWQGAGSGAGGSARNGYYTNWNGTANPDNAGSGVGEDFMIMQTGAGLWNDVVGTGTYAYVIEWEGADVQAALAALQNGPYTIDENSAPGSSVGFLEAFDSDAGDTLTYTATGGTGAALFAVDSATGAITLTGALDHETLASYTLDVRVQDGAGLFAARTIIINVADINDAPTAIGLSHDAIDENSAPGTLIGTLSSTDADLPGDSFTYTIINDPGHKFVIMGDELRLAGSLDFEAAAAHSVTIRTDDGNGGVFDQVFTIMVRDINEAPLITLNEGADVVQGRSVVITAAMLDSHDPDDQGAGLVYTVSHLVNGRITVGGAVQTSFTQADIDAGRVSFVHSGAAGLTASFDIALADGGEDGTMPDSGTFRLTVTPAPADPGRAHDQPPDPVLKGAETRAARPETEAGGQMLRPQLWGERISGAADIIRSALFGTLNEGKLEEIIRKNVLEEPSYLRTGVQDVQGGAQEEARLATIISEAQEAPRQESADQEVIEFLRRMENGQPDTPYTPSPPAPETDTAPPARAETLPEAMERAGNAFIRDVEAFLGRL